MSRLGRIIGVYAGYNHLHSKTHNTASIWCSLTTTTSSLTYKRYRQIQPPPQQQQQQVAALHIERVYADLPIKQYYIGPRRSPPRDYFDPHEFSDVDTLVSEFRRSLETDNTESIISTYARLDPSILHAKDVRRMATHLSHRQRQLHGQNYQTERKEIEVVRKLAATMIDDLQSGKLPSDPMASLHLLAYFRDTRHYETGKKFWAWLREQDRSCTDARTYGAAIELFTWAGVPLSELETLYQEALMVDPGHFGEYHFSPNAIVAERTQYTPLSGIRLILLQGIQTARVKRGDWRNAYLALDTAVRLGLDLVPRRFFEMLIYQRPVSEGWKIFMLACMTGVPLAPKMLTVLLTRLNHCQSIHGDPSKNVAIAKAGLTAVEAHAGARGELSGHHLTALASLLLKSLYTLPPGSPEDKPTSETLEGCIQLCIHMFRSRGVQPMPSLFNLMILRAAKLNRPSLVGLAASGLSKVQPDVTSLQLLLEAGGELSTPKVIEESWEGIVNADEQSIKTADFQFAEGKSVGLSAWKALAKACYKSGHQDYLKSQMSRFDSTLNQLSVTKIREYMSALEKAKLKPRWNATQPTTYTEADVQRSLTELLNLLRKVRKYMLTTSRTYDFYRFPMVMDHLWTSVSLPDEVRSLYEQVSTDPHLKSSNDESRKIMPAITPNLYPVADLRFVAWKIVGELLIEAEINEETRKAAERGELNVDLSTLRLISPSPEGEVMPRVDSDVKDFKDTRDSGVTGISRDVCRTPALWPAEEVTSTILRLRGMELPNPK